MTIDAATPQGQGVYCMGGNVATDAVNQASASAKPQRRLNGYTTVTHVAPISAGLRDSNVKLQRTDERMSLLHFDACKFHLPREVHTYEDALLAVIKTILI